ncbi:hypothetical protein AQV86_04680 [Nanohaloarchaea archaeon SG9]|nr:hypothetical protein AQV86_04680 [Nanohaloarchaea archaeon SG9]
MNKEKISRQLLEKAGKDEETEELRKKLAEMSETELSRSLDTENVKKAFWLNIYNAYTQILLKKRPSRYRVRTLFFMKRYIEVAGKKLSLNSIEHGILRSSKLSFGFGYLKRSLASGFEKKFRVEKEDPRIHFALNCGAKACPPINFYRSDQIDSQLEKATENYLNQEVEVEEDVLYVPRVFYWFRGDFGGKKDVKEFLSEYGYEPEGKKLKHRKWNWEMELEKFEGEQDG